MDWVDAVGPAADIAQAGAVIVAAIVGIRGLNTWRKQLIGGKKVEVAEQTLVAVHDVLQAIRQIRSPFIFRGEGSQRVKAPGETAGESTRKDSYFAHIERMKEVTEDFEKLNASKHRCRVHFGEGVVSPFNILLNTPVRIGAAVHILIDTDWPESPSDPSYKQSRVERKDLYAVMADHGSPEKPDDFMQERIEAAAALERILMPAIRD